MQPNKQQPRQKKHAKHESQTQDREIHVKEDKTIVKTDITTVLTPKQTVERYNNLVKQLKQISQSIDAYQDKIEEVLDEHNETMAALHTMIDDHPQDYPETVPEAEESVDFFTNQDLQRYHNIQEMRTQLDKMNEQIQSGVDDLDNIHKAARKMADNHGFELEDKPSIVKEEIGVE